MSKATIDAWKLAMERGLTTREAVAEIFKEVRSDLSDSRCAGCRFMDEATPMCRCADPRSCPRMQQPLDNLIEALCGHTELVFNANAVANALHEEGRKEDARIVLRVAVSMEMWREYAEKLEERLDER